MREKSGDAESRKRETSKSCSWRWVNGCFVLGIRIAFHKGAPTLIFAASLTYPSDACLYSFLARNEGRNRRTYIILYRTRSPFLSPFTIFSSERKTLKGASLFCRHSMNSWNYKLSHIESPYESTDILFSLGTRARDIARFRAVHKNVQHSLTF